MPLEQKRIIVDSRNTAGIAQKKNSRMENLFFFLKIGLKYLHVSMYTYETPLKDKKSLDHHVIIISNWFVVHSKYLLHNFISVTVNA